MLGGSPGGVAANGTRSGNVSFDLRFMLLGLSDLYFPASLGSRWVWFPPVITTMKALTSASRSAERSVSGSSPCLSRLNFRAFRLQPPYCHFACLGLTRYHRSFTVQAATPTVHRWWTDPTGHHRAASRGQRFAIY
jgi:hypothetical protein